ncbi:hypothetical protein C8F04DRAFT_1067281 [Mycena alexandri]|uniref:Zn(2)-C6 fungal-type domain-containing protein n=1 Tax=Mycena alexandri TaxID=1745969 RepID=A0AAD6TIR8_9AGAR|nr:hypothetical protein C8F04DRAFT_1067281 [Mycena alexandri]
MASESDPQQIVTDQHHPQHPQHPQHHQIQQQTQQQQAQQQSQSPGDSSTSIRKPKGPSVRRACTACHAGKTRCSEVLPCQNCLKRGLGNVCAYADSETPDQGRPPAPAESVSAPGGATFAVAAAPPVYAASQGGLTMNHQQYYDYNGTFTGASSTTFRAAKRPRTLTEEETAVIKNFSRGDFFVGNSAPVRIDPRLPVRLTLGEGDHVHFNVGNYEAQ